MQRRAASLLRVPLWVCVGLLVWLVLGFSPFQGLLRNFRSFLTLGLFSVQGCLILFVNPIIITGVSGFGV